METLGLLAAVGAVLMAGLPAAGAEREPFQPTKESLAAGFQCPEWFRDAKFGIYFHWGPYSVPAFGSEWYSRNMYQKGSAEYTHHLATYGPLDRFGYKDFIPMFRAERFDADAWVDLFVRAGARYAGPVAEHADGFAMWDSKVNPWNAARMGPKRDIVGEMTRAVRKRHLKLFASLHHQWLWGWYATDAKPADVHDPAYASLYGPDLPTSSFDYGNPQPPPTQEFSHTWRDKGIELVDRYKPDLLYFDSRLSIINEQDRLEFMAHYYNQARRWGKQVAVTFKAYTDYPQTSGIFDVETGRLASTPDFAWQTDDKVDWNSWAYLEHPNYKPVSRLVHELIDIVSKNGNLLLDIGPRPDGTIPEPVKERLLGIGAWLKVNGEAIYGTRPYRIFGEGPTKVSEGFDGETKTGDFTAQDLRFTTKGDTLFALCLATPSRVVIKTLGTASGVEPRRVASVKLLGSRKRLEWKQEADGLVIQCPTDLPSEHALAFRIGFSK
ncbi:MAG TPA: alpha-L-fucosidase [Armatimonadota bacterium]|jgi:alpha-L-fucosidase